MYNPSSEECDRTHIGLKPETMCSRNEFTDNRMSGD